MSPVFWKFMDWLCLQDVKHIDVKIVTNLSHSNLVDKALHYRHFFRKIKFAVSVDAYKQKAEFVRHGLNWVQFDSTLNRLLRDVPDIEIDVLGTVNILALDGLIENLDWYRELKKKFASRVNIMLNPLRWPEFQSITVLPQNLKNHYSDSLTKWVEHHKNALQDEPYLFVNINAIITLLGSSETLVASQDQQKDFKTFVVEFARRRSLDIGKTFSKILTDWILEEKHA
jgi:hypothetical protein